MRVFLIFTLYELAPRIRDMEAFWYNIQTTPKQKSSRTDKLNAGKNFSDDLGLKHYKKDLEPMFSSVPYP